jgi:hypothetical protein
MESTASGRHQDGDVGEGRMGLVGEFLEGEKERGKVSGVRNEAVEIEGR